MATMARAKVLRIAGLDDRLTDLQVLRNRQDERTLQLRLRRELLRRAGDEADAFCRGSIRRRSPLMVSAG
jgi:hypothetical protein